MSDKNASLNYKDIILIIVLGTAGSTLFGYLIFGTAIVNPEHPGVQFPAFGLIASAVFALLKYDRLRDAIFLAVILGFFNLIFINHNDWTYVVTYIVYFISVFLTILIFTRNFYFNLNENIFARPLVLSSILAIAFIICTIICWIIFGEHASRLYALQNMPIGFLIGLGIGIGIEIAGKISNK